MDFIRLLVDFPIDAFVVLLPKPILIAKGDSQNQLYLWIGAFEIQYRLGRQGVEAQCAPTVKPDNILPDQKVYGFM